MNLTVQDRIALLLGRAVMRAESLQVALEEAEAKIAELAPKKPEVKKDV